MDDIEQLEHKAVEAGEKHAEVLFSIGLTKKLETLLERQKKYEYEVKREESVKSINLKAQRILRSKKKEEKEEELRSISEKGEVPEEDRCQHFDRRFKEPKQCPRERKKPTNYCVEHFSTHMKKTNDIMKVIPV
jgi:hypothetical protein